MSEKNDKKNIVEKIIKSKNFEYILLIVVILVVVVIFFTNFKTDKDIKTSGKTTEEYIQCLEINLSKSLSTIKKVGKVKVIITVESGFENIIAMDKKENIEIKDTGEKIETSNETPVLVGGKPIILKEVYPKIKGVCVMAEGSDDISVKLEILRAIQALLEVPKDNIEIFTMK